MKFVYKDMGHILRFDHGCVNELVVENKKMFFDIVNNLSMQVDGAHGDGVLSIADKQVEMSRYADLTVRFAPFELNRKSLLNKLYASLEQKATLPENYTQTSELLGALERYILCLSDDLPFEINCQKLTMGAVIRALAPELEESDSTPLEKIFSYMELVRELDREKLFIMVNMRTYFLDEEIAQFAESVCLHDFKVLLLESFSFSPIKNVKRYTVDQDLCEF